jgi:hypothetical protein
MTPTEEKDAGGTRAGPTCVHTLREIAGEVSLACGFDTGMSMGEGVHFETALVSHPEHF